MKPPKFRIALLIFNIVDKPSNPLEAIDIYQTGPSRIDGRISCLPAF